MERRRQRRRRKRRRGTKHKQGNKSNKKERKTEKKEGERRRRKKRERERKKESKTGRQQHARILPLGRRQQVHTLALFPHCFSLSIASILLLLLPFSCSTSVDLCANPQKGNNSKKRRETWPLARGRPPEAMRQPAGAITRDRGPPVCAGPRAAKCVPPAPAPPPPPPPPPQTRALSRCVRCFLLVLLLLLLFFLSSSYFFLFFLCGYSAGRAVNALQPPHSHSARTAL